MGHQVPKSQMLQACAAFNTALVCLLLFALRPQACQLSENSPDMDAVIHWRTTTRSKHAGDFIAVLHSVGVGQV